MTNQVVCTPKDQCHSAGDCYQGLCSDPVKPDGTPCDDGDPTTLDDVCTAGLCAGVDPCEGVTCTSISQCHGVGECRAGTCTEPELPDGTACDDQDAETYLDVCFAGICAGSIECSGSCVAFTNRVRPFILAAHAPVPIPP